MIVTPLNFDLDAYIPNRDDAPNSDILGNEKELQGFIDKYEPEVLIRLLGYELAIQVFGAFAANYGNPGDEKYKRIVEGDGEGYTGLEELLVGYIFYHFIKSDDSHYASAGVVKENSDTATRFESRPKAVENYRKFYRFAIGDYYKQPSVFDKPSIWGNLRVVLWSGPYGNGSNFKSLYQFMTENIADYPNWEPEGFANQNYFDI